MGGAKEYSPQNENPAERTRTHQEPTRNEAEPTSVNYNINL